MVKTVLLLTAATILAGVALIGCSEGQSTQRSGEDKNMTTNQSTIGRPVEKPEKAIFAAGCFWGVESAFRTVPGVVATRVGYTGGHTETPSYRDVCSHTTGHAEAVEVTFDPALVSYEQLLDRFWSIHDPTTPNRQGPDVGSQYRSAIFYLTPEQKAAAEQSKQALDASGKLRRPVVTEITRASTFWQAEEYHQQYEEKHGIASCHQPAW